MLPDSHNPPDALRLPHFITPMLAAPGQPFDSDEYLFEIKWDGTRALAFIDSPGQYRLMNRRKVELTSRYPDLAVLSQLPPGTMLDGEIVVLRDGKPDFQALQSREQVRRSMNIPFMARQMPATYVVFDILFDAYQPVMSQPLTARRDRLGGLLLGLKDPRLVICEGITGDGQAYFDVVCAQGLEGLVAKRLNSPYVPGHRSDAWIKIKRRQTIPCAIIGFLPDGEHDFRSLLLAAEENGQARYVGRVGSGIDQHVRGRLIELLWPLRCDRPVVPCRHRASWVDPRVYCNVSFMERTASGHLRSPVFVEIRDDG